MRILVNDQPIIGGNDVRVSLTVGPIDGITEESRLEIRITHEGIIADLVEVTDRCNGSSEEVTRTFSNTFEEFAYYLLR